MPEKLRTAVILGLRFLFLTRYSWLLALALLGLPPMALVLTPALLENLFVLDVPVQMFHVSWITIFSATTVITTLRITTLNGIDRFDDYRQASEDFQAAWGTREVGETPWYKRREVWLMLALGLAASLSMWYGVVAACVARTAADPGPGWGQFVDDESARTYVTAMAWNQALYGLAATLGALLLLYLILTIRDTFFSSHVVDNQSYRYTPGQRTSAIRPAVEIAEQPFYEFLTYLFGPGYFRAVTIRKGEQEEEKIVLAPGHAGLVLCTSLFLAWYSWNYWSVLRSESVPDDASPFPALFYGQLSLLLVILLLPGVAFLLDRHRIPVIPTLLLTMALFYACCGTDHVYEVNPEPLRANSYVPRTWDQLLQEREMARDGEGMRTLVVVDASGGGIQAAAWTAQVLTGLHELYGEPFSRSVGLISSVSGGSVGSMFYLANRSDLSSNYDPQRDSVLSPTAIQRIRASSRASGLEATCWGIAYPDTMRAVFPPLARETVDRGWSIEQSWRDRMKSVHAKMDDVRLSDVGRSALRGTLPIPVFNATLVETGQRLLISPVLSPPPAGDQPGAGVELMRAFPTSHMRVSTAARMSATFPYVTPVARPRSWEQPGSGSPHPLTEIHVADGAYADNEGAVTSVDWINRLLVHYSEPGNSDKRPFDRILLIRIQPFPRQQGRTARATNSLAGWRAALLGPFDTMMQVRSASQTERGDLEVNLLTLATRAQLRAAKENAEREFQMAMAQIDQIESLLEALQQPGVGSAIPADLARQISAEEDRWRIAVDTLQRSHERQYRLNGLQVESVVFDFQPVDGVPIPLSWKLTARQQRQIDRTWSQLVQGSYPSRPLAVVDKYFRRLKITAPGLELAGE